MLTIVKRGVKGLFRLHRRMMAGKTLRKRVQGILFDLQLSENIDSSLYYYGYYEKDTTQLLDRLIKPGHVVLDVGANIGAHSLPMAQMLLESSGQVHAFEPTSWAYAKLQHNLGLNHLPNLHLYRKALSDRCGTEEIVCAETAETLPFKASWDISGNTKNTAADTIEFQTLDSWVDEVGLPKLDLLKIDVDGYEVRVLRGAKKAIARYRPVIVVELGTTVERVGDRLDEALQILLDELGYSLCSTDSSEKSYTRDEAIEIIRRGRTVDFLCRPAANAS